MELNQRDDRLWEKEMKEKLTKFYMDSLLPEILDPRLSRNMKIQEPYILSKNENNSGNDKSVFRVMPDEKNSSTPFLPVGVVKGD